VALVTVAVAATTLAVTLATRPGAVEDAARPDVARAPQSVSSGGIAGVAAPAPARAAAVSSATPAAARVAPSAPRPAEVRMPGVVDSDSSDAERWREQVAARLDRITAAAQWPYDAAALDARADAPDSRPAALGPGATPAAASGTTLPGWDGGPFWFGPSGLVRVFQEAR
jgi:hypothetical protein